MDLTPQLLHLVEEYASGIIRCTPIKIGINDTKGLRPIDFYHLILESVDSPEHLRPKSFLPLYQERFSADSWKHQRGDYLPKDEWHLCQMYDREHSKRQAYSNIRM